MKYFITINQLLLAKTNLDIKDAAILDYIRSLCSVDDKRIKQLSISDNGVDYKYTWLNFNHLIKEMPLLGIRQKASISNRLKKIEKAGYIKIYRAPDRSLYIRLLPKIKELDFTSKQGVSLNKQGVSLNKQGVLAKTNSTNIISFNNNINNNINNIEDIPPYLETNIKQNKNITPADEMWLFINSSDYFNQIAEFLIQKGFPSDLVRLELNKFKDYWTESNKSGTKQRWELEKTFELKRRLVTWFNNVSKYNQQRSNNKSKQIINTLNNYEI